MKIAIFILAVAIGLVSSELCGTPEQCHFVVCSAPQVPTCDSNVCTCTDKPGGDIDSCQTAGDCSDYFNIHSCRHQEQHCYDTKCTCRRL
ncbi:hypothetical protein ACF0H5_016463 [Mactra antiquata]